MNTSPVAAAQFTFKQYEVVTGSAKRQTVLTGFLLDSAVAELAVVNLDENGDRRLRIYEFSDRTWVPRLDATLGPEVLFVDVANIGGRDRLVTYEPGRLNWFDPASATERTLVAVTSSFTPPRRGEIPHTDVSRDVNGDGRDDLVVPQVDGFSVSIQTSGGGFADPVKVGTSTDTAVSAGADGGYRYTPWDHGRIHETDYNRDGRTDLVFWNEDHFEARLQDQRGLFDLAAETFTTDVAFDSDDLGSLSAPYRSPHSGKTTARVLHTLADLNGDGYSDLLMGRGRHELRVFLGVPGPELFTRRHQKVPVAVSGDEYSWLVDLNKDGKQDVLMHHPSATEPHRLTLLIAR